MRLGEKKQISGIETFDGGGADDTSWASLARISEAGMSSGGKREGDGTSVIRVKDVKSNEGEANMASHNCEAQSLATGGGHGSGGGVGGEGCGDRP